MGFLDIFSHIKEEGAEPNGSLGCMMGWGGNGRILMAGGFF